jgi:hypothetical protein
MSGLRLVIHHNDLTTVNDDPGSLLLLAVCRNEEGKIAQLFLEFQIQLTAKPFPWFDYCTDCECPYLVKLSPWY